MGLFDSLRALLRSASDDAPSDPAERATPGSDPERMYGTSPGSDGSADGRTDRDDPPTDPPERFAYEAEECADLWAEYDLDFTVDSLSRLDDVAERFGDQFAGVEPDPNGDADARSFDRVVRSFGSYLGETLVRDAGDEWRDRGGWVVVDDSSDRDPVDPFAVATDAFRTEATFTSVTESGADG
ncbi:hypothetical protein [Haloarchaeobius sp. HRN-SO-5]|uniref:hypothetical protein n=1 Tax=Haloarchaeobius sp. HRN-SO-5 TaxID=3446118 RepID=UPI003EB86546